MGKQLGGQHQIADPHPFVRAVEVGVKSGQGAAEGHAAGDVVDIGAAADGQTPPLLPCRLLIASKQGLDKGGIIAQRLVPLKVGDTLKTSYDALDKAAQEQFQQAFQYYKSCICDALCRS